MYTTLQTNPQVPVRANQQLAQRDIALTIPEPNANMALWMNPWVNVQTQTAAQPNTQVTAQENQQSVARSQEQAHPKSSAAAKAQPSQPVKALQLDTSFVMLEADAMIYPPPAPAAKPAFSGPRTFTELRRALESTPPNGVITLTQDITEPPVFFWQPVTVNSGISIKGNGHSIGAPNDPSRQLCAPMIGGDDAEGITVEDLRMYVNIPNIDSDKPVGALAAVVSNATLSGVTVEGVCRQRSSVVGGMIGEARGAASFFSCVSKVDLTGRSSVGGLVGYASGSPLFDGCYNRAPIRVTGDDDVYGATAGGIVGSITNGTLIDCVNEEKLLCRSRRVGGIAGEACASSFMNCMNKCDIEGADGEVGGVAGTVSEGTTLMNCQNMGSVSPLSDGEPAGVAGIVGTMDGNCRANSCRNFAAVNGKDRSINKNLTCAGGIAGRISGGCQINGCSNTGTVRGGSMLGGIAGMAACETRALICRCYNSASVLSASVKGEGLGGVIGTARGVVTVIDSMSGGNGCVISGGSDIGGIIGLAVSVSSELPESTAAVVVQNNTALPQKLIAGACTNTDGIHRIVGRCELHAPADVLLSDNLADSTIELTGSNSSLRCVDYNTITNKTGILYKRCSVPQVDPELGGSRMNGANRNATVAAPSGPAPIGRMR